MMGEKKKRRPVTDEEFGSIARKCWELQRRAKEGTLDIEAVKTVLDFTIEGLFIGTMRDRYGCTAIIIRADRLPDQGFLTGGTPSERQEQLDLAWYRNADSHANDAFTEYCLWILRRSRKLMK